MKFIRNPHWNREDSIINPQHYKSTANSHIEFHMKPCSFHLKQDNLELEYAHGKAARMIKSQSKE